MLTRKERIRLERILLDYPNPPHKPNFTSRVIIEMYNSGGFNPATMDDIKNFLEENNLPVYDDGSSYDLPDNLE